MRNLLILAALIAAGCDEIKPADSGDTGANVDPDTETDPPTGTDTDEPPTGTDTDEPPTNTPPVESGWAYGAHPCDSRTDALWFDDTSTGFLGCGQATTGDGFWTTSDGGMTWAEVSSNPIAWFNSFRVNDIFRDPNTGLLHAAGTGGGLGVVALDAGNNLVEVWTPGATIDTSFTAGTFRTDSTGFAVVESLTGSSSMSRADGSVAPTAWDIVGTSWSTDGLSHQILDLEVHDDQFYGVGSTIGESPYIFVPTTAPVAGFAMDALEMSSGAFGWYGELWAIDVDAGGVVAGGVDQAGDAGHIFSFVFPGDPVTGTWYDFNLATLWPSDSTWIRGVCREGDHVVAVGEFSSKSDGIVLESHDGGASFTDVTPTEFAVPTLWDCWVHPDGSFVVSGASFYVAKYTP